MLILDFPPLLATGVFCTSQDLVHSNKLTLLFRLQNHDFHNKSRSYLKEHCVADILQAFPRIPLWYILSIGFFCKRLNVYVEAFLYLLTR